MSNSVSLLFDGADHSSCKGHADDLIHVHAVNVLRDRLMIDDEAPAITGRDDDATPAGPGRPLVLLPVGLINPDRLIAIVVHEVALFLGITKAIVDHVLSVPTADFT